MFSRKDSDIQHMINGSIDELLVPLKQRLQTLEEENRQLRSQLAQVKQEVANLRQGIGITVYIDGKAVLGGTSAAAPDIVSGNNAAPQSAFAGAGDRRFGSYNAMQNKPPVSPSIFPSAPKIPAPLPQNDSVTDENSGNAPFADMFLD